TSFWNPGRSTNPEPDFPRSSSIVMTRLKPSALARFTRPYCLRLLSAFLVSCATVDCRMYTAALFRRCSAVIFSDITDLVVIDFPAPDGEQESRKYRAGLVHARDRHDVVVVDLLGAQPELTRSPRSPPHW